MQSNPIQQRIELICEKWEEAKKHHQARVVRIECQADELDMVDTFYTYMIGADTPIMDIAFHFESAYTDPKLFSRQLLNELEDIIHIWNNSQKDPRIEYVPIRWKPDYSREKDKNPAAMFVDNFNRLAEEMDLEKQLYAVAIFKTAIFNKEIILWLQHAIKAGISPAVKFLVHDPITVPHFRAFVRDWDPLTATIPINLNMPKAMEQTAAMGDPKDPATAYRQTFMKMINAMTAQKEEEAEKWGTECLAIATQHLSRDPYWITQIVVVYVAMGNDKIRYKKKQETLAYANKAVETAIASQTYFENEMASVLLAQSLMFRGTVLQLHGNFADSHTDFSTAYPLYKKQNNMHLAIEACRMAGKSALKAGLSVQAIDILADGARLGRSFDTMTANSSTYPGLLELLLKSNHIKAISIAEIDEIARNHYGKDWMKTVFNWKQPPEKEALKQQEAEAATS